MSRYQLVTEASLGRVLGKYFEIGFIIISAERSCSAEKQRDCSDEEQFEQEKLNKQNERSVCSPGCLAFFALRGPLRA